MLKFSIAVLLVFTAILTGCAGGRSYDYSITSINVHADGDNKEIALGVHDQREYVKNGQKYPQYVGTQRSPAYVPWNINTKSGLPMADDFLLSIERSLKSKGFRVNSVALSEKENRSQVITLLKGTGANKLLLFTINEWFFDIWYHVRISCSMKFEVFNTEGKLLASAEAKQEMWDNDQNAVPDQQFKLAVEKVLNDEKIIEALNTNLIYSNKVEGEIDKSKVPEESVNNVVKENGTPVETTIPQKTTEEKLKCTTDQILKMKGMGMADSQIKAACQ